MPAALVASGWRNVERAALAGGVVTGLTARMPDPRRHRSRTLAPDLAEVEAVYAELERRVERLARDCRLSTRCCRFQLTGEIPLLTRGEALLAARGVRASGRKALKPHPQGACPLLGPEGRCLIYQRRPFGCRTHFCRAAGGVMPRALVADLIQRLEAVDEKLGGDGSRTLPEAIAAVLD